MEDTIDLKHARVTLVSALVWRAIAELARRHHTRHAIRLEQVHPGISLRGLIRLHFAPPRGGTTATVCFNLGGQSGTWSTGNQWPTPQGSVAALLGPSPAGAIDDIERALGWPVHSGPLPPSTPQVLALRLLAALLEQAVFHRTPWRVTLGVIGWQEVLVPDWVGVFGAPVRAGDHDALRDLALFHRSEDESSLLSRNDLAGAALAVRMSTGELIVLTRDSVQPLDGVAALYEASGRNLAAVAAGVWGRLGPG